MTSIILSCTVFSLDYFETKVSRGHWPVEVELELLHNLISSLSGYLNQCTRFDFEPFGLGS